MAKDNAQNMTGGRGATTGHASEVTPRVHIQCSTMSLNFNITLGLSLQRAMFCHYCVSLRRQEVKTCCIFLITSVVDIRRERLYACSSVRGLEGNPAPHVYRKNDRQ